MKTFGVIFSLWFAASVFAQSSQGQLVCRQPLRVVSGHPVNLVPLFDWWRQQAATTNLDTASDAERPLASWHRITGVKAGEAASSWVINAVIYASPTSWTNARIFLNNPPVAEEKDFYTLKAQLAGISPQITNALRTYQSATNAAQRAEDQARKWRYSGSKQATENSNYSLRLAKQKRDDAAAALDRQMALEAARPQLQQQFNAIPAANGRYQIDLFALEIGRTKKGVPIYDMGAVPPHSP
jgi:hypothetical protein